MRITRVVAAGAVIGVAGLNPVSPAGYVGYVTQGAVFGKTRFYELQTGPTSPGRTWLLSVINVSVTPYTYHEDFAGKTSVLSRDNLKISFSVHLVWKVRPDRVKDFVEKFSTLTDDRNPDRIVQVAYANFLQEPLRTFARDEIQRLNGLEIKDRITPVGEAISRRVLELTQRHALPGHERRRRQHPVPGGGRQRRLGQDGGDPGARAQANRDRHRGAREAEAHRPGRRHRALHGDHQHAVDERVPPARSHRGAAGDGRLAQHTTIYIPVGPMGVPIVGTFDAQGQPRK